jgi:hypothetical protein
MAITQKYLGNVGNPTDAGNRGLEWVRLTLDGALTSFAVTLPNTANGKLIRGCLGGTSHNIPAAGVSGSAGFTAKFPAGTNGEFLDLLLICD